MLKKNIVPIISGLTIFLVIMVSMSLCACTVDSDNSNSNVIVANENINPDGELSDNEKQLKEYIIANSILTEEDFDGIDFSDFIGYMSLFDVDQEHPDGDSIASILQSYKKTLSVDKGNDYSYIIEQSDGKYSDESNISVMFWTRNEGTLMETMIIDFVSGAVYYDNGDFLDDCTDNEKVADIIGGDYQYVVSALEQSGIGTWKNSYQGTDSGTTGHYNWSVGFEFEDGKCALYSGSGVMESGTPEELEPLLADLRSRFATR